MSLTYMDTGLRCYREFSEYPELTKMDINPKDSIMVIMMENPSIAFAVMMSIIMIVLNAIRIGHKMTSAVMATEEDCGFKLVFGGITLLASVLYVFNLMMPITAVAYYSIAPHF